MRPAAPIVPLTEISFYMLAFRLKDTPTDIFHFTIQFFLSLNEVNIWREKYV